jgi:hypothetical protein
MPLTSLYPRAPRWPIWKGPYLPGPGAPINKTVPQILGELTLGSELECTMGNWAFMQAEPHSYHYYWYRNDKPIPGANTSKYVLTEDDIGNKIFCELTAVNPIGPTTVFSSIIDIPAAEKKRDYRPNF